MSGIVGIYNLNNEPVSEKNLGTMVNSILHRGPDKQKIWFDDGVGFGCVLLQTTPEAIHEELPYFENETQLAIVADARIDNRNELLTTFDCVREDAVFISDSSLVLSAYKKWGCQLLQLFTWRLCSCSLG